MIPLTDGFRGNFCTGRENGGICGRRQFFRLGEHRRRIRIELIGVIHLRIIRVHTEYGKETQFGRKKILNEKGHQLSRETSAIDSFFLFVVFIDKNDLMNENERETAIQRIVIVIDDFSIELGRCHKSQPKDSLDGF